ncbi:MAG: MerR family transcriptional regulator [Solirubrobacterales bacterium]|nr:MerR family transcriptional regulator [Solirubrobacterales bacterium]MCB8971099.1 MerR family transcriptional regulator [Thermoleophilales bacterium]MCO5327903.1 MerR family transcriptional regulator [Solirubrobacterales bacterium]
MAEATPQVASPVRELRIGEVAKRTGVTPRTIRYYEEIGLLPAVAGRDPGSHRLYGERDVERLEELLQLKEVLGVTLEELREIATAESARAALRREWHEDEPDAGRRREIIDEALGHVASQLELVRRRKAEIEGFEDELVARRRLLRKRLREIGANG